MHLSFVLPIIHPENRRVKDYGRTLLALRATLDTLVRQTHRDISVVVCCHRLPPWHARVDPRVHFLLMEDHPELPFQEFTAYDNEASEVDKGIKLAAGFAYAHDRLGADYVMLMDADDFAHVDLARRIHRGDLPDMGRDGWNVTRGYNLEIETKSEVLRLRTAYEVKGFHRNCGSCRIFSAAALNALFGQIAPSFGPLRDQIPHQSRGRVKTEVIEAILSDVRANTSQNAPFMVFAYHKRQERLFDLADVDLRLMAKGCGHSNHSGQSEIFWYRVVRQHPVEALMQGFGMQDSALMRASPDPMRPLKTQLRSAMGKVRQVPPSLRARLGWMVSH